MTTLPLIFFVVCTLQDFKGIGARKFLQKFGIHIGTEFLSYVTLSLRILRVCIPNRNFTFLSKIMVLSVKIILRLSNQNNRHKTIIIYKMSIISPVDMHILSYRDATYQSECRKLTNQVKEINCYL